MIRKFVAKSTVVYVWFKQVDLIKFHLTLIRNDKETILRECTSNALKFPGYDNHARDKGKEWNEQ